MFNDKKIEDLELKIGKLFRNVGDKVLSNEILASDNKKDLEEFKSLTNKALLTLTDDLSALSSSFSQNKTETFIKINDTTKELADDFSKNEERIDKLSVFIEERRQNGIMFFTKLQLQKHIDDQLEVLDGNVNAKIYGLIKTIDNKIANIIGQDRDSEKVVADLLKKVNELENVSKVVEGFRNIDEVLDKYKIVNDAFLKADREEKNTDKLQGVLRAFNWVMGKENTL